MVWYQRKVLLNKGGPVFRDRGTTLERVLQLVKYLTSLLHRHNTANLLLGSLTTFRCRTKIRRINNMCQITRKSLVDRFRPSLLTEQYEGRTHLGIQGIFVLFVYYLPVSSRIKSFITTKIK